MKSEILKASIIVLTYKKFDNIIANIRSILKQTYRNYEVIISDDGSPNFEKEFLENIIKSNDSQKFMIITREKNVGTVKNYNVAVREATGDIIVPLSQDDEFFDEKSLSNIVKMFHNSSVNVCLGLRKDKLTKKVFPNDAQLKFMKNADNKMLWFRNACNNLYWGAALYYRKNFLISIGLFDESYTLIEDYSTVMKLIGKGEKIYIMDVPTILYGVDGITKSSKKNGTYSLRYYEDNILISKNNIKDSQLVLNSAICRQYLKYKLKYWESQEKGILVNKYTNIILDIIILFAEVNSIFTGEDINECRFNILWKIEDFVTNLEIMLREF